VVQVALYRLKEEQELAKIKYDVLSKKFYNLQEKYFKLQEEHDGCKG
jgi:chaperonin cofactor prefoldin